MDKFWFVTVSITGITGLCTIVWYMLKQFANRIVSRLDRMVIQNEKTMKELVRLSEGYLSLESRVVNNEERLNNHAKRLRETELKHARCEHNKLQ